MPFYRLDSDTRYLYHYTKPTTLVHKILQTETLRLGSVLATNDPREARDWRFGLGARSGFGVTTDDEFNSVQRAATSIAKGCCKVICFAQDRPGSTGMAIDGIYLRGFCKPRMWAQYAEDHTGACMVFDRVKLVRAIHASIPAGSSLFEGAVSYVNRSRAPNLNTSPFVLDFDDIRRRGVDHVVRAHVHSYWRELFFEKLTDWGDEHEYRWMLWDTKYIEHIFRFSDALVGVLLGPAFPAHLRAAMSERREHLGFKLSSLNWKNGVPEVLPER